nr:uncharacterized mitochondrial protein AtMg00810-like [Tanacetum cinerariifolium]
MNETKKKDPRKIERKKIRNTRKQLDLRTKKGGRLTNLQLQVQCVRTDNGTEFKNKTFAKFFDEAEAIATACFTQNRLIINKRFDKTPYELMNKRKPNIKFFRVFKCRCYLLNDYEDVGKVKAKGDIRVFVGYSKESAAFRIYNKRTRKIHESVNVNFDEISEMASKQFSLEPVLSNLNETGKSSNLSISQVDEPSKKDLEDLFQYFYDEYFDSSKIMKSSTTNVETSNNEEVFHEVSESFQRESSSSSLNDDVKQSLDEVILPQTNTQWISNNTIPNSDEASTSHNMFNERFEDAYFDANTSPDIMFATCMCAKYQANPNKHHVSAVKRIFRYLKGTINLGLWYPKDSGFDLTTYSDADPAGCHLDRKSTSGSVQFLGDKLVCWSSKKQNCVSISIAESEYVAVSGCCAQVLWMRTQLTDYGFFYDKVPIYYDSKSAIVILCNPVQHTRTKHIDVRYHFIKDHVEKGTIDSLPQNVFVNKTKHDES